MSVNQLVFKYLVFYPVVALRGERVAHFRRRLEASQWSDPAAIQKLQRSKLDLLIASSLRNVPLFSSLLGDGAGEVELTDLPFTSKEILRDSPALLRNRTFRGRTTIKTTGGSTGRPVTLHKSRAATAQEQAANWRGFGWAGIRIGDRQGRFWGVPITRRARVRARLIDLIANRTRCSAFAFGDVDLERYTQRLNRFRPRYLYGYVSMLRTYAAFLRRRGESLRFQLSAVITTAEVLTPSDRTLLESTFGARVYNEYGCGELGTLAHECERGSMHLNSENLIVEILDGTRHCSAGEVGEVVVTELNNSAMPLVRYRLGDFAALSAERCPCGRSLPVLDNIYGRAYDLIYNRSGHMFHGEFFMYVVEEAQRQGLGIGGFQIIQDAYDHFTIRVQPSRGYGTATEDFVRRRITDGYGPAEIDFVRVDRIQREASGKMRLIIGMKQGSLGQPAVLDSGAIH